MTTDTKAADTKTPAAPPPAKPADVKPADPKAAAPVQTDTTVDRIRDAVDPEAEPADRVNQMFAAVTSELTAAGDDIGKLNELKDALNYRSSVVSRVVEEAIDELIADAKTAEPPPAKSGKAADTSKDAHPKK